MQRIKNFNLPVFITGLLLLFVLTGFSLLAAFARDEGTLGSNIFLNFSADLFWIVRFPMHNLFWRYMNGGMFFIGLFINCVFYAAIIERMGYLFSAIKRKLPGNN